MKKIAAHLPPSVVGGIHALSLALVPPGESPPRTIADAVRLSGCSRTQVYEHSDRLFAIAPSILEPAGRPKAPPPEPVRAVEVVKAVRDFYVARLEANGDSGGRRTYSDEFRRFVVGLADPGRLAEGMSEVMMADLVGIPFGTLHEWLHPRTSASPSSTAPSDPAPIPVAADDTPPEAGPSSHDSSSEEGEDGAVAPAVTIRNVHIELIVAQWRTWEGSFQGFCNALRTEHRIPYGHTFIGNVLQGLRLRWRRCNNVPVEAPWSSETYWNSYPGAHWLADGTELSIEWEGKRFDFNLEAILDVASNAMVGLHVSDAESAEALRHAYRSGVATTGAPPLALTLDNKAPNHCPEAQEALADTTVLRATPGRGQAKAPLEGAFGLFQQAMPPLLITGDTPRERAACVLLLVAIAFYRGRNGRPRRRLGKRSPVQAYAEAAPTPEEVQQALEFIKERERRAQQALLTKEARRDPVRLGLLIQGLVELGIPDPDRRIAITLAYYDPEAIARGLATFAAKRESGTVPHDADPVRYLGGIIRSIHTQFELERFADHILHQRLRLHDLTLEPLHRAQNSIRTTLPPTEHPQAFIDRALQSTGEVDARFWRQAAVDALAAQPVATRLALYHALVRRISISFKVTATRRRDLIDRLAGAVALAA